MKNKILLIATLLIFQSVIYSQTAGSGTISTIESLVNREEANSDKMADLNRQYQDTYVSEDLKLKRLNDELYQLQQANIQHQVNVANKIEQKKYEIANSQSWKNRLKSAQSGYKEYNPGTCSAGGPPPICSANHWYSVSYQEAMAEYNNQVQKALNDVAKDLYKYQNQLTAKSNELQKFQFQENEFQQKRRSLNDKMNEIQEENQNIRERIKELSKKYVSLIENESKESQQFSIKEVMSSVAEKNFSELKTIVIESKIEKLDEEEKLAREKAKERLRLKNEENIQKNRNIITNKKSKVLRLENEQIAKKRIVKSRLSSFQKEKTNLEYEIKKETKYTIKEIDSLNNILINVLNEIKIKKEELISINNFYENENKIVKSEIKKLEDDIWNLQINLPTLQNKYLKEIEEAFLAKRNIINDALEGRKHRTKALENTIVQGKEAFRVKVNSYSNKVEEERIRLLAACKKSGSSCWGSNVVSKIWSNANGLLSCTNISKYQPVQYQSGECKIAYAYYQKVYNNYLNGISDQDLNTFKKSRYSYKYSDILGNFKN